MSYGVGLRNGVAFALGTIPSLTSGGGLRPSLLLNFLSGSLDSRITFSRGTQATQYTSNGTLQYAPNNLLTYSNQADNAAWTKSNSFVQTNLLTYSQQIGGTNWITSGTGTATTNTATAPDGTVTASRIVNSGAFSEYQTVTVAASTAYVFSFYAKNNGGTVANYRVYNNTGSADIIAITSYLSSISSSDYTRITVAFTTPVGCTSILVYTQSSGVGGGDVLVWGAQLVQGSVLGDYVATTSAALPVLYADYQGKLRARKLCETTAPATQHAVISGSLGVNSFYVTLSVKAKAAERTVIGLYANTIGKGQYFNLANGTVGAVLVSAPYSASITPLTNGYYLCSITVAAGSFEGLSVYLTDGSTITYTGDGSSGIYIADAQLEAGSVVQAYNDTTSAAYYGPRFDYDPTNYVQQNLLTYSNDFSNAAWVKTTVTPTANATLSPDGAVNGWLLTNTSLGGRVTQNATAVATTHTYSAYAKTASASIATYLIYNQTTASVIAQGDVNLATGVATAGVGTMSSVSAGNGWYRVTLTASSGITIGNTIIVYIYPGGSSGAAGASVYFYGAQLNTGSTALTYTATTTAPYTLCAARGLLIEEQRVNLLLQSNDFQTSWTPTNITRTLASTTGPDGTLSGVKLEATAAVSTVLFQAVAAPGTAETFSVYVKQGTGATTANSFLLRNNTTATNLVGGTLNYSTGVFTYTTGSTGVTVTSAGNGWWRITITATAGITAADVLLAYVGFTGSPQTAGDFLYAYGAQLEAGAFATSYIPTVGSQVTRAADSASITTLTPWFNAAQGTLYAAGSNFVPDADSTVRILAALTDTISLTNAVRLERVTNLWRDVQTVAGVASVASGTWTFGTNGKLIGTYQSSNSAATFNGTTPTAVGTATMPSGITSLGIGCNTSTGNSWNGWISTVTYYPTRLPNATLQGLTV